MTGSNRFLTEPFILRAFCDLIVQAKSGTGKTCVFTVVALEMIDIELERLQVLILTPTREISVQVRDVISGIGKNLQKLKVETFIGGLPLESDKKKLQKCQIAVGAPGRVKHLIETGLMKLNAVRLFVLDEADKLMESSFRQDISSIYLKLPEVKQMIAVSATFPPELESFITRYMTNPMRISSGKDTFLIGIRQFVSIIPSHLSVFVQMKNKMTELCRILSMISFKQCLVFSNSQSRAESICNKLNKEGWPAIYMSGSQNQTTRLKAMSSLKEFRCRVLLSTDLTSRGIDAENVNLVINLDIPYDASTYMHRMGRAGRYGTHGMVITIVQSGEELDRFCKMLDEIRCSDFKVYLYPKEKVDFDIWEAKDEDFEKFSCFSKQSSNAMGGGEGNQYLNIIENKMTKMQSNFRELEEKETKTRTLEEAFAFQLRIQDKPFICEYDDLIKVSSQLKEYMEEKINKGENQFYYEDYSPDLKSLIIYLAKKSRKHYKKRTHLHPLLKTENKNKVESSLFFNENKNEGLGECAVNEKGQNIEFQKKFSKDLANDYENEFISFSNSFSKDCIDDSNEDSESERNEDTSEWELEENCCEKNIRSSFYVKQWYYMWCCQLSAVRYYASYFKHFHYWNELKRDYGKY